MAARRSARNSPMLKEAQEGVKGGTLAGGSPFAGGLSRPQPVRPRGAGGGRRKGSSRTPTPTAGGKRAVCHVIYCEVIPRPGGGRRNGVTPAVTAAAGRRGRRPLQGGCGNVRSAIIPRPGGGGTPPLQGGWRNTVGSAETVTAGRRGRRPLRGFACLTVVRKKNAASGRHFSLCVLVYITIAFLGQMSWQVPQAMHLSSSRVQVLAARSTARAPAGHFLAQSVQ